MKGFWIILMSVCSIGALAQPGSSVPPPNPSQNNQLNQPNTGTPSGTVNPNGNNQLNPSGQPGTVQPNTTIQPGTNINNSFNRDYKGASNMNWQRSGDNYSVDYMYNGANYNSTYSSNGTRLGTSTRIDPNSSPAGINQSFQNGEYSKWRVGNIYQLNTPDNKTYYQYDVSNGNKTQSIYYDSNGKMLKKRPY